MYNVKFKTEIIEFLAFITWAIITKNNLWYTKIAEYVLQGIRTSFLLSQFNYLITGNLENRSTTTKYVLS